MEALALFVMLGQKYFYKYVSVWRTIHIFGFFLFCFLGTDVCLRPRLDVLTG